MPRVAQEVKQNVPFKYPFPLSRMAKRIVVKLREAVVRFRVRTGRRMTYAILGERIGLTEGTLRKIASDSDYSTTLETIAKICEALDTTPQELLELADEG